MQLRDGTTLFSSTDLVAYLECERLTVLDFQALGTATRARKGDEHEQVALVNRLCWVAETGQLE